MTVPRVVGSGAYSMKDVKSALKPILREALSQGGAAIGGLTGIPGGSIFGRELGKKISKLVGSGDYETNVSVNELIHPPGGAASASFGADGSTIRVRRREFIQDILAPSVAGTFTNVAYEINAGMRRTFPFLSQLAANYEEYCFDGLVFEFISSASPYIANTSLGTVIASMQYNATSPSFTTKYTMENSANAISTRIDKNLMYGVECAAGSNPQNCYYVRSGGTTLPYTTTDLGKFEFAISPSTSIPSNAVVGELWVTYDVSLKRPRLDASRYGAYHLFANSILPASPCGTAGTVAQESNTGICLFGRTGVNSLGAIAVAGDVYMMSWHVYAGTVAAGVPSFAGIDYVNSTGIAAINMFSGDITDVTWGGRAGAALVTGVNEILLNQTFKVTAPDGVISVVLSNAGANWPTGANPRTEIYIMCLGQITALDL